MLKLIFNSIILFISAVNLFSQITLTSIINPRPGDIRYNVTADTTGINPGNPGPNQNWNFTTLVKVDSTVDMWLSSASTPFGNLFPAAQIALLDTCYNYYDTSITKMEFVGYYSSGTAIHLSNFQTILSYPFTYNSVMNDSFAATIQINGDVIIRKGATNVVGDAWGTMHLSYGTFPNALRLKHTIAIRDSSTMYQMVFTTNYTVYEWYVPGRKFAVFQIVYININFEGQNVSIFRKNVFYNPNSTPIGITPISGEVPAEYRLLQNYPNPFNPSTKIRFSIPSNGSGAQLVKLMVYDILGREADQLVNQSLAPGSYEVDFNGGNLASGTYFYRLDAGSFTDVKKLTLVK